jgi:hypothetical protein
MSSPICRHKFRESRLAPSFNDERNWEGSGRQLRETREGSAACCWWLVAEETTSQAACSSRQTGTQQRDLPFSSPRRCLCFVFQDTFYPPQFPTTTLYTAGSSRTNASRLVSTENINSSSASQLPNMSYRVGMYRTYDLTALAIEICC